MQGQSSLAAAAQRTSVHPHPALLLQSTAHCWEWVRSRLSFSALHLLRGLSLNSLKCLPLMEAPVEALRGSGGGEGVGDALTWTCVHPWLSLLQLQGWAPLLEGMPWFRALRASAFHLPRGWQPNNVFQECSVHSLNV